MRTASLPIARLRRGRLDGKAEEESDTVVVSATTRTQPVGCPARGWRQRASAFAAEDSRATP